MMRWQDSERSLMLNLTPGSRMLLPAKRMIEVRVAGEQATKTVVFEGHPLKVRV